MGIDAVSYIEIKIYDAVTGKRKEYKVESIGFKEPTILMYLTALSKLEKEKEALEYKGFF